MFPQSPSSSLERVAGERRVIGLRVRCRSWFGGGAVPGVVSLSNVCSTSGGTGRGHDRYSR
jgi:hypothetical protein